MLAVVDDFIHAGMQIGTGSTAEIAAALEQLHAETGFGERAGGAHARDSASDYGDGLL